MRKISPIKYFNKLSISKKFYILIGFIAIILIFQALGFWFVLDTMGGIRAYVRGEGLWSKAQKESVVSLIQYSSSFDQADYERHLQAIKVPLGDRMARTELEKEDPDYYFVEQGFLHGGNHPEDIENLIFLFEKFRSVSYIEEIIDIWSQADVLLERQIEIGNEIHSIIVSDSGKTNPHTISKLRTLTSELISVDEKLTLLEDRFSERLGEASRSVNNILFIIIVIITIFLAGLAFTVFILISRVMTRVDKAKSEFVALASHQLRTPLTMIKLATELLEDVDTSSMNEEDRKYVEEVSQDVPQKVTQMASLIESILNVSRIELGTLVVDPKNLDVIDAGKKAVEEVRPLAKKKSITLEEKYSSESCVLPMDESLLHVIFHNLLTNAIKYSPEGGKVHMHIVCREKDIEISIVDTGYGIPKEVHKKIFTKLFRAKNAKGKDPGGTGLGLYIVKSIVTETGGDINFYSEEGKGTHFTITFPRSGMQKKKGNVRI